MSKKAVKKESGFVKVVKAPYRALCRVGDFYVRSVTDCSGKMSYGAAAGPSHGMPRNFSVSSSRSNRDEDLTDLIRAASQKGLKEKLEIEIKRIQEQSAKKLPRSATVGIGRIDEDNPVDFDEDYKIPRSRSAEDTKRRTSYAL